MKNSAKTPDAYVKSLPADRRDAISRVRKVILKNLPKGFEETIDFGVLAYVVPLKRLPNTYNGRPLPIAALASQKQYMSVYVMCAYSAKEKTWLQSEFKKAGKKLDMGKCCVRFKKIDDLPLDVIGKAMARVSVDNYIKIYEKSRKGRA